MVYSSGALLLLGRADALDQDPLNRSRDDIPLDLKLGRRASCFMSDCCPLHIDKRIVYVAR